MLKIDAVLFGSAVMCPKDADGMANSIDPDQNADLGLHCMLRPLEF